MRYADYYTNIVDGIKQAIADGLIPALAYDRVSTAEQEKTGLSLVYQQSHAAEYATRAGLHICHCFTIAESARNADKRKTFREMIATARQHNIKHLIFKSVDRMSRNHKDLAWIEELIDHEGLSVHFYQDHKVINAQSNHNDRFVLSINLAVAKQMSDKVSHDSRQVAIFRVKRGVAPGRGYDGYLYDGKEKCWVIDRQRENVLRYIFDTYDSTIISLRALADELNAMGYRSSRGGPWTPNTLHRILSSHMYYGYFDHHGEVYKGVHEPYFSEERYAARMERMGLKYPKTGVQHDFLLKGFLRCEGYALSGELKRGSHNSGRYIYYTNKRDLNLSLSEKTIIDAISEEVGKIRYSARFADMLKALFRDAVVSKDGDQTAELAAISRRIGELESKSARLIDLFLDEEIDQNAVRNKSAELRKQIEHLEKRRQALRVDKEEFVVKVADVIESVRKFPALFSAGTPDQKIRLLRQVAGHVEYFRDGRVAIAWKRPFMYILDPEILKAAGFEDVTGWVDESIPPELLLTVKNIAAAWLLAA